MLILTGSEPLNASDKCSFDTPIINNEQDWESLLNRTFINAKKFANLIKELPPERLSENFSGGQYDNYKSTLHGIIQHTHDLPGQTVD